MAGANKDFNLTGNNANNADPFEEFEFRPINEGLGFHRKQKNNQSNNSSNTSFAISNTAGNLTSGSTNNTPATSIAPTNRSKSMSSGAGATTTNFQSPLPRPETNRKAATLNVPTIEDDSIAKAQTAVNDILKSLNHKRQLDFVTETNRMKGEYKKSKPHFFAATLDTMLITAAFLMSLILMLSITKVDLFMNLTHPNTSGLVYFATAALFLGVTFIYMIVNRAFLGATPGEWAFDQICGQPSEIQKLSYIPKLAARTLLVMITGFVTLPIFSYLLNKDVAGNLTGVSLYKKPNV